MSNGEKMSTLERNVFHFCRNPDFSYISLNVRSANFKKGKISQLNFHKAGLPPEPLRTEIEIFSTRIERYLHVLDYSASPTARMEVRDIVKKPDEAMSELLKIISKNFKKNS